VALRARRDFPGRRHLVRVRQRETGCAVIKRGARPRSRVVACRALPCGESCRHVIRYASTQRLRARPRRLVASVAVRVRCRQRVVVVDVAQRAGCRYVGAGQRESRRAVIKGRGGPAHRRMAIRAVRCRERWPRTGVHWIVRLLPRRQVASRVTAIRWRDLQIVIVVDVAGRAGHIRVPVRQQESRRAVIKCCRRPSCGGVATRAVRRSKRRPRGRVGRIICLLPGRQVASRIPAIRRLNGQVVIVIDVAQRARHVRMSRRQQKSGRAVVELRSEPAIKRMAALAISRCKRRSCAGVWRVRGALPVLQVARIALRR